jgi:hypothetical protein
MKTYCILFCFTAALAASVLFTGCDSISAVAKDKKNQVEKYLKDKTVLQRANVQLEDAKKSRAKLKEIADKFAVDSEVALRQVKRVEDEAAKSKKAFENLQDIAKNAGLPKKLDAKEEDLKKQIPVGSKTLTGEDVYRTLKDLKTEVSKAASVVAREKTKADFLKKRSGLIKDRMDKVDDNIAAMEQKIEEYKMYHEMVAANKSIDDLGLDDDQMKQLLDTDSILTEMRKKVDEAEVGLDIKDKESATSGVKEELSGGSSGAITDDDLI